MAAGAGPSPAPVPQRQQAPYKRKWERSSVIRQGHSGNSNIFWAPPRGPHHEGPTRPGSYTHLTYNSRPGGGLYAHPGDGTKNYRQREKKTVPKCGPASSTGPTPLLHAPKGGLILCPPGCSTFPEIGGKALAPSFCQMEGFWQLLFFKNNVKLFV